MGNWYDILPISQIDHRLFVGGYAQAANLVKANPAKISAVLCVHQEMDYPKSPEIVYMHIPFADGDPIPQKQFVKCLGWLKFMWENGHTILIHCAAGISRSVTITASFMHYIGMTQFDAALSTIKKARPVANPAPSTLVSAKKMLGVWPYDGSMDNAPDHELMITESFVWMDSYRLAQSHPDEACPTRVFLLNSADLDTPRHTIPCTCQHLIIEEMRKTPLVLGDPELLV